MNGALPIRQGFRNASSKILIPCSNPYSRRMTYPSRHYGKKNHRTLFDIRNPLGGYICESCTRFRRPRGVLLSVTVVAKIAAFARLCRKVGPDATCGDCKRTESQFVPRVYRRVNGVVTLHDVCFKVPASLPDEYLCCNCYVYTG